MINRIISEDGRERARQFMRDFANLNTQERGGGSPFSGARAYRSTLQSITTGGGSYTAIQFSGVYYDTDGYFDVSNNTRLTAPATGYYRVTAHLGWAVNSTGRRDAYIEASENIQALSMWPTASASLSMWQNMSTDVYMVAGEYARLMVAQTSGGNLSVLNNNPYSPILCIHRIG